LRADANDGVAKQQIGRVINSPVLR
jgi:hypothetical protein